MKIRLEQREDGKWQADVWTPDGKDYHAIGEEPWEALIQLGFYWQSLPRAKDSDMETLARIISEEPTP